MSRVTQVYEIAETLRQALASGKAMTNKELSAATGGLYIRASIMMLIDAGEVEIVKTNVKKIAHRYVKTYLLGKTILKRNKANSEVETPAGVLMLQSIMLNMSAVSA